MSKICLVCLHEKIDELKESDKNKERCLVELHEWIRENEK